LFFAKEASAQYEEWYLECTVLERSIPKFAARLGFIEISRGDIYASFNNGGSLNVDPTIIYRYYAASKNGNRSPATFFKTMRFRPEKPLAEGKMSWTGSNAHLFPKNWKMTGDLNLIVNESSEHATYTEAFIEGNMKRGYINSECVFNNPN
jgi:hypothetical protein